MATYAFDFIGEDGMINSVDVGAYVSDIEAVRQARQALRSRLTAVALDIWRDGRRLIHLTNSNIDGGPLGEVSGAEIDQIAPSLPSTDRSFSIKTV